MERPRLSVIGGIATIGKGHGVATLRQKRLESTLSSFIDQADYLGEKSLGTLCLLWERQHLPLVSAGTKQFYDAFFQFRLTEEAPGQLSSRIALHYLFPELTQAETLVIPRRAIPPGHHRGSDCADSRRDRRNLPVAAALALSRSLLSESLIDSFA